MTNMDERDIELIRVLQREEIFTEESPFGVAAELLGWEIAEVLDRSKRLKEAGVIRRFGAALTPRNAGFRANAMVAWDAAGDKGNDDAALMSSHPRISHCYIRPRFDGFPYNLYTMMHANTPEELTAIIDELSASAKIKRYRVLNSLEEFKKSSPVYFPRQKPSPFKKEPVF